MAQILLVYLVVYKPRCACLSIHSSIVDMYLQLLTLTEVSSGSRFFAFGLNVVGSALQPVFNGSQFWPIIIGLVFQLQTHSVDA